MTNNRWEGISEGRKADKKGAFEGFSSVGRSIVVRDTRSCFLYVDHGFEL